MRYKVIFGKGNHDYAICYGDDENEAGRQFIRYNPEKRIIKVEPFIRLREMASEGDEHEFLINLIDICEDTELEGQLVSILYARGYGRPEG